MMLPEPAHLNPRAIPDPVVVLVQRSEVIKPRYPLVYVFWDSCLHDANALVMTGDASESRKFRWTLLRSFLLHMLWPLLLSAVFVLVLAYYPAYMIWFAWIGFVLFIFVLYRVKEFFDTFYYLTNPSCSTYPSPDYYEGPIQQPLPPPAYSVARGSPPAYFSVMSQPSPC